MKPDIIPTWRGKVRHGVPPIPQELLATGRYWENGGFLQGILSVAQPHVHGWPDIQGMAAQAELAGVNKGGHRVGRVGKRG